MKGGDNSFNQASLPSLLSLSSTSQLRVADSVGIDQEYPLRPPHASVFLFEVQADVPHASVWRLLFVLAHDLIAQGALTYRRYGSRSFGVGEDANS